MERTSGRQEISDKEITRALEARLEQDPAVSSYSIDIIARDGVVTLSGTVDNLLAEQRAINIAQGLRGVEDVKDSLTVKPVSRLDTNIGNDVRRALAWDATADLLDLDVQVENGIVTLSGNVENWQEQQAALQLTKSVSGVRGIENEIEILESDGVSDQRIAEKIKLRLENDIWIDAPIPEVAVNEGGCHFERDYWQCRGENPRDLQRAS